MAPARPRAPGCLLAAALLSCKPDGPPPAPPDDPLASAAWLASATLRSAGGERCTVSRPDDLGATLTVRGGPSDVRIAASRRGTLVAWMQPHPTKAIGRLVAVRALDRQGRPVGAVQTMQPPIAAVLREVVADDDGFYVLVQAPDQPRASLAIAVRPDGSAAGEFVEIPDAGGLAPVSHGPARGAGAAVLYGPEIGGRDSVWVTLARTATGAVDVRSAPVARWRGLVGSDGARVWVGGDGRHALLHAAADAPLELISGADVVRAAADLPGPILGLDARWRGDDIDLVWGVPADGGPTVRRATLRPDGAVTLDPPGLPAFEESVELAWSFPPLHGARRTRAGRPLVGDAVHVDAADPELTGGLLDADWAWTGEVFVVGYPAQSPGGVTARTIRVACPRG